MTPHPFLSLSRNASDGDGEEIRHLDEEITDGDGEDIGARDGDDEEICHLHINSRSALSRQAIRSRFHIIVIITNELVKKLDTFKGFGFRTVLVGRT